MTPPTAALPIAACPFCGLAEFTDVDRKNKPPVLYHPYVPDCPASNRTWSIENWNRRAPAVQETADNIVQANIQCNACHRSLVGVTTGNYGCDRQCKPHGFACGLYGLKTKVGQATADAAETYAALIPSNWLYPLLTGPNKVIGDSPYGCPDIEALLNALRERIRKAVSPKAAAEEPANPKDIPTLAEMRELLSGESAAVSGDKEKEHG